MAEDTQNPQIDATAGYSESPAEVENTSRGPSTEGAPAQEQTSSSDASAGGGTESRTETIDKLWEEIGTVADPEIGIAITELGLVYDVQVEESKANVTMTLTSMGCPVGPQIQTAVHGACLRVDGIEDADVEIVFSPPWNPREMASEEAQMMLGLY